MFIQFFWSQNKLVEIRLGQILFSNEHFTWFLRPKSYVLKTYGQTPKAALIRAHLLRTMYPQQFFGCFERPTPSKT